MNRIGVASMVGVVVLSLAAVDSHAQEIGNPTRGKAIYQSRCAGCHSIDVNKAGPLHRGVVGRRAGSVPGYTYSSALTRAGIVWDEKSLDQWLASPEKLVPGQAMDLSVETQADRRDLISFLATLR